MTDMEEFRRFNAGVCNSAVVDAVDRWRKMPERDKENLREKWAEDDAEAAKIINLRERDNAII